MGTYPKNTEAYMYLNRGNVQLAIKKALSFRINEVHLRSEEKVKEYGLALNSGFNGFVYKQQHFGKMFSLKAGSTLIYVEEGSPESDRIEQHIHEMDVLYNLQSAVSGYCGCLFTKCYSDADIKKYIIPELLLDGVLVDVSDELTEKGQEAYERHKAEIDILADDVREKLLFLALIE